MNTPIIKISNMQTRFGSSLIHKDINLEIYQGEILAIIGSSGSGKTTILRSILMLLTPASGTITVFDKSLNHLTEDEAFAIRRRLGMLFQQSALFSSLNVLENIIFPMKELADISQELMEQLALLKIALVGLPEDVAFKYPSELSGGMQRRAAAARALAMDPELLFLDEPTSGLDPLGARQFDDLILFLRDALNLTIVLISHDMETLSRITDRIAFIGDGKVLAIEPYEKLIKNDNPMIVEYFKKI